MTSTGKSFLVSLVAALLILSPALSPSALAATPTAPQTADHVVSSAQLQRDVAAAAQARQANAAEVEALLSTPRARRELKRAGMNYRVIRRGIPLLSQQELAKLAARAGTAQRQFKAGALTNQQLTYIIIALAAAVLVLIAVH